MKPDEHKKKKNALYKKKHGIAEKNKEVKGQGKGKGSQSETAKRDIIPKKTEKDVDFSKSSDSSDEDEPSSSESSKVNFQRRKVVSNWDRYELPPDEEIVTPKGENFAKLLQVAGDSTSQFKFKEEEEEWTAPEQSELSLDLQDLSSSISCVPLYKLLRLSQDLFTTEQIEEYDRLSRENQNKYQSKCGVQGTDKVVNQDRKEPLTIESTALDELLDSVCLQPETDNKQISIGKTEHEKDDLITEKNNLESDLDDLLSSGEQEIKNTKEKKETAIINHKNTTESQEDDLEDWLDSVLDS